MTGGRNLPAKKKENKTPRMSYRCCDRPRKNTLGKDFFFLSFSFLHRRKNTHTRTEKPPYDYLPSSAQASRRAPVAIVRVIPADLLPIFPLLDEGGDVCSGWVLFSGAIKALVLNQRDEEEEKKKKKKEEGLRLWSHPAPCLERVKSTAGVRLTSPVSSW